MKTTILTLALALAFSFTATPAAAGLSNQTKCDSGKLLAAAKFSQCRIKVDFIALKKGDKLSAEKKTAMEDKCDAKINAAFVALEGKYPETMSDSDDECSTYGDAANMIAGLVAVSDAVADGSVSTGGADALATSDNQTVCEDAGGTWESDACAPVAVADRDCFREGACGANGFNAGRYQGATKSSSGCDVAPGGSDSYDRGTQWLAICASTYACGVTDLCG